MSEKELQTASNSDKSTPPEKLNSNKILVANIKGISTPFICRQDSLPFAKSIFGAQEYLLPIKDFKPKLILDCGGNIGCSAVYFANKYPDAQIYSVEPQKDNFKLLQYNTFLYEKIHVINSAVWDKETYVNVNDDVCKTSGSYMTSETTADDPRSFKTTTISKLLAESGFDEIDLLKIDIEGAEKEVFGAPDVDEWLSKVKVLTIELHDRMKRGCSYEFFKAMSKYHWHFALRGENLIFMRE